MSLRNEIISYISAQYGAEAEYPWKSYRNYCVFRRKDSGKWFAIIMDISRDKLGLEGDGKTDIIDLKTGPMLADLLRGNDGYLPAYHLSKENWITVLLDGSVGLSDIRKQKGADPHLAGTREPEVLRSRCRARKRPRERFYLEAEQQHKARRYGLYLHGSSLFLDKIQVQGCRDRYPI